MALLRKRSRPAPPQDANGHAADQATSDQPLMYLPGIIPGRPVTIVVDHVSKWYGDVVAVSDVSLGVGPGVTGLLGPNGAGKSTLLKMMSGLLATSSGSITINGQPARGRPNAYRQLGLVPEQEFDLPLPHRARVRAHECHSAETPRCGSRHRPGNRHSRDGRRIKAQTRRLLEGHETADQSCRGPRSRSQRDPDGRAAERHRPRPTRQHHQPDPPVGRRARPSSSHRTCSPRSSGLPRISS